MTPAEQFQVDPEIAVERGSEEPALIVDVKRPEWTATLYDLLSAYAAQRQKRALARVRVPQRQVWSLAEARAALERLVGGSDDWSRLDEYLVAYVTEPGLRATVYASSFAATLEMVREGLVEIHQHAVFAPIYLRKRIGQSNGAIGPHAAAMKAETKGEEEGRG